MSNVERCHRNEFRVETKKLKGCAASLKQIWFTFNAFSAHVEFIKMFGLYSCVSARIISFSPQQNTESSLFRCIITMQFIVNLLDSMWFTLHSPPPPSSPLLHYSCWATRCITSQLNRVCFPFFSSPSLSLLVPHFHACEKISGVSCCCWDWSSANMFKIQYFTLAHRQQPATAAVCCVRFVVYRDSVSKWNFLSHDFIRRRLLTLTLPLPRNVTVE